MKKSALLAGVSPRIVTPYRPKVETPEQALAYVAARTGGKSHAQAMARAAVLPESGGTARALKGISKSVARLSEVMSQTKVDQALDRSRIG